MIENTHVWVQAECKVRVQKKGEESKRMGFWKLPAEDVCWSTGIGPKVRREESLWR